MSNHLANSNRLGSASIFNFDSDGKGGLSDDALTKAILFQLGKLGSGNTCKKMTLILIL
jgi:hypothetical protein